MKQAGILLVIGVAVAVIGMMVVVLGVISGPLFYPGIFILTAGVLLSAAAGILSVIPRAANDRPA